MAPRFGGTATTRTVLSALPEMSMSEVGLKRIVVGGKSCALRIVSSGCSHNASSIEAFGASLRGHPHRKGMGVECSNRQVGRTERDQFAIRATDERER